jgi:hypothetical protein
MADRYAGIAEMTVGTDDGLIVLDLSTPEPPQHTRLRIERQTALDLCDQIMDAVDALDGGRWW